MASAASSSWLSQTERRLHGGRKKDIEGSGFARWREASKIISDHADVGPSLERSQIVLNSVRKDLGSKKLQFSRSPSRTWACSWNEVHAEELEMAEERARCHAEAFLHDREDEEHLQYLIACCEAFRSPSPELDYQRAASSCEASG